MQLNKTSDKRKFFKKYKIKISNRIQKRKRQANRFFYQGKISEASKIYRECIEIGPRLDRCLFLGLGIEEEYADYQEGQGAYCFQQINQNKSQERSIYDSLGLCFAIIKNYSQAEVWYKEMLSKNPQNYKLHLGLAITFYNLQQYQKSEEECKQIIQIKSQLDKPYQILSFIYYFKYCKYPQAKSWAYQALIRNKDNTGAQLIAGCCEEELNVKLSKLKQLVKKVPNCAKFYNYLALTYKQMQNVQGSIENYKIALKINPQFDEALFSLGEIYQQNNLLNQAISLYEQYLTKNKQHKVCLCRLANCYQLLGYKLYKEQKIEEAMQMFTKHSHITLREFRECFGKGLTCSMKGQYDGAIKYFRKCVQLEPDQVQCYVEMINIYHKTLSYDQVVRCYEKCIELNPDSHFKKHYQYGFIAKAYRMKKNNESALTHYQQGLQINPYQVNYYSSQLDIYIELGRIQQAVDLIQGLKLILGKDSGLIWQKRRQMEQLIKRFEGSGEQWREKLIKGIRPLRMLASKIKIQKTFEESIRKIFRKEKIIRKTSKRQKSQSEFYEEIDSQSEKNSEQPSN